MMRRARGWQHWAQGLALTVGEAGLRPDDLVQLGGCRDAMQLDHLFHQHQNSLRHSELEEKSIESGSLRRTSTGRTTNVSCIRLLAL